MNQILVPSMPAPVMKLNDLIAGTVVTMDEWVQNEIYRLRNNIKPRHFKDYSELVYMFEDPSRFQALNGMLPPAPPELIYNVPTDDDDDDDDDDEDKEENNIYNTHIQPVNNYNHFPSMTNHDSIKNQFQQDTLESDEEEDDEIMPPNNELLTPPIWLCKAFIELMRYCDKLPSTTLHEPKKLLLEFENLQREVNSGQIINVNQFRNQLTSILFGKIQLTEHLVSVWKLICEWVTRPPIHNHQNALRWIELSLSAYITAKKIFY